MRRITAIPCQKITFKNVPVSGLFFSKRTLYQKISIHEATIYSEPQSIFFEPMLIVRFITKQQEGAAIEAYNNGRQDLNETKIIEDFVINDIVEITQKNILGKVVSVNKRSCVVQFKDKGVVGYDEFKFMDLQKRNK